eukprot:1681031-Rhodomonas_salina.1
MRNNAEAMAADLEQKCFVSSVDRFVFNSFPGEWEKRRGGKYIFNYLFYFVTLLRKDPEELNGLENVVCCSFHICFGLNGDENVVCCSFHTSVLVFCLETDWGHNFDLETYSNTGSTVDVLKKFHEDDVEFFPIETFVARSECKADCRLCRNDACGVADQEFTIESSDRMIPRVRCRERALGGEAKKEDLHEAVHNLSSGGSSLPNCNPLSQNSANLLQDLSVSSDQCCLSVRVERDMHAGMKAMQQVSVHPLALGDPLAMPKPDRARGASSPWTRSSSASSRPPMSPDARAPRSAAGCACMFGRVCTEVCFGVPSLWSDVGDRGSRQPEALRGAPTSPVRAVASAHLSPARAEPAQGPGPSLQDRGGA